MIIRDFEKQNVLSPQEIAALVKRVPARHVEGLQSILFKPITEFMAFQIPVERGCKGAFYAEYRSIVIFDLVDRQHASHIIFHELGHYVFHRHITSSNRKKWTTQLFPQSRHLTRYGSRNAVEDFAETYALYLNDPLKVQQSVPAKYNFMRLAVFI